MDDHDTIKLQFAAADCRQKEVEKIETTLFLELASKYPHPYGQNHE